MNELWQMGSKKPVCWTPLYAPASTVRALAQRRFPSPCELPAFPLRPQAAASCCLVHSGTHTPHFTSS